MISMPVTWALVLVNCFILTVAGDLVLSILAAMLAVRLPGGGGFYVNLQKSRGKFCQNPTIMRRPKMGYNKDGTSESDDDRTGVM